MLLADDVRIRIEAGVFLTTDVEIAAMTQGQEALSAMMSHWVNTQSTSELFVMLWHSPETFCPPDLLLACLKIESAPVKLLASTKLLQNSTEHQLEAIRELCRLANTADMNLRYAALAALAQKRVEGRLELNNDEVRRIEGDDPEIDALMGVLHGQVDVDLVSCALQTENSWLHGLVARAAARQCANDQTHDALRHVLNTDRQFAILSAFDQLFKMGRRPEQEISDIDRIFQDPDSSELLRRTRQLQREAARN